MSTPVRIAVVGLGNFGRLHAQTLAHIGEAHLVGLIDSRETTKAYAQQNFPTVPHWSDLDRAINECDAEAWVVASSTASHVPLTKKLLSRGKRVLLEKPLAETLVDAEQLKPLANADSSNLMLAHIVLFNSEFRELLDEARQRGPIAYIDCVRHRPATTMDLFPGESPFELTMVHDLYLALALTGGAEPIAFSAQAHYTASGACDLAKAQLQWADGTIASFAASFMTPAGMPSDGFDRLEVFGDRWAARILPNPRPFELWDERAHWPMALEIRTAAASPTGMLAEELRTFCRVIRNEHPVPVGARYEDALQIQRWLDRLEAIARKEQT